MTANQLIEKLNKLIKDGKIKGSAKIIIASDEEGNSYGTVEKQCVSPTDNGNIVLYPWREHCPLYELDD